MEKFGKIERENGGENGKKPRGSERTLSTEREKTKFWTGERHKKREREKERRTEKMNVLYLFLSISIIVPIVQDWEMLVLNHLQWNLLQSTPFEFFDQLLVRCPVLEALREDFALTLHRTQKGGQ